MHWFLDPVKNQYADFTGRAGRQEFWMYILVYIGLYIALAIAGEIVGIPQITILLSLAVLAPNLAITARRLHDVGKSGWWQLISLIPVLGAIILIVWLAGEGKQEANEYGVAPRKKGDTGNPAPQEMPVPPVATEQVVEVAEEEVVEENTKKGFGE